MQVSLGLDLEARGHITLSCQAVNQAVRLFKVVFIQDCPDYDPRHVPVSQAMHGDLFGSTGQDLVEARQ